MKYRLQYVTCLEHFRQAAIIKPISITEEEYKVIKNNKCIETEDFVVGLITTVWVCPICLGEKNVVLY